MSRFVFTFGIFVNQGSAAHLAEVGAKPLGVARLYGYKLAVHGPMTLHLGPSREYCYGLLWELNPEAEAFLDRIEGYPHWYGKDELSVVAGTRNPQKGKGEPTIFCYRMPGDPGTAVGHNNLMRARKVPEAIGLPTTTRFELRRKVRPTDPPHKAPKRLKPAPTGKAVLKPTGEPERVMYFGYGSNLSYDQIKRRCPSAEPVKAFGVEGWRLEFHSGFANISREPKSTCYGAIYTMTEDDARVMDGFEGLYDRLWLDIGGVGRVLTYQMRPAHRHLSKPSKVYARVVAAGYKDWGLPAVLLKRALSRAWVLSFEIDEYARPAPAKMIHEREVARERRSLLVETGVVKRKKRKPRRAPINAWWRIPAPPVGAGQPQPRKPTAPLSVQKRIEDERARQANEARRRAGNPFEWRAIDDPAYFADMGDVRFYDPDLDDNGIPGFDLFDHGKRH